MPAVNHASSSLKEVKIKEGICYGNSNAVIKFCCDLKFISPLIVFQVCLSVSLFAKT